jgi:dipeptidyl aminopeptidase/acylaminoacyl peptidase
VWTAREFPAWYRAGILDQHGGVVLTAEEKRIWGRPTWAPTGELAVGGFVGIRRVVYGVEAHSGTTSLLADGQDASYELVDHEGAGVVVCRRRSLDGSVALVRTGGDGDEVLTQERPTNPRWRRASLVSWSWAGLELQGILVPPAATRPPWPTTVFLHGGPVGSLAAGEADRVGAWTDSRWATFIPEFPASGICGEAAMLAAFAAEELPDDDHEVEAVLAGIDTLVESGLVDEERLFVVGHSYGAYLMNRALTRSHRFRAAVCWEGVADLRLLDQASLAMQATWRGGHHHETPERWSAASPIDRSEHVRTPTLLFYGADSSLVAQGQRWYDALHEAGVPVRIVVEDGVGHTFGTQERAEQFHELVADWVTQHLT